MKKGNKVKSDWDAYDSRGKTVIVPANTIGTITKTGRSKFGPTSTVLFANGVILRVMSTALTSFEN